METRDTASTGSHVCPFNNKDLKDVKPRNFPPVVLFAIAANIVAMLTFGLFWHNSRSAEVTKFATAVAEISYLSEQQRETNVQLKRLIRVDERTLNLEARVTDLQMVLRDLHKDISEAKLIKDGQGR